jgi:CheY-like chemotaxis protein
MAVGIAHDFNNALTILLSQCHHFRTLLASSPQQTIDPAIDDALAQHERTIHDIAQTIRTIRRSALSPDTISLTPIALNDLVTDVIHATKPKWSDEAQSTNAPILITTNLTSVPLCMGNPSQLRHTITNLLFNAVDAMPRGGNIHITTVPHQDWIVLQISDTGVGMSLQTQALAFEPFFTTKGPKGTGIGLTMVRDTIQRHGGTIAIESLPGRGTTVTVKLPTSGTSEISSPSYPIHPAPPRLNILAVDDRPELTTLLTEFLHILGHNVTSATDPNTALQLAAATPIDMLITDYCMPGMSGLDLAGVLTRTHPALPVILVTGWNESPMTTPQPSNPITEMLYKPYTLPQLQAAIASTWAATHPSPP